MSERSRELGSILLVQNFHELFTELEISFLNVSGESRCLLLALNLLVALDWSLLVAAQFGLDVDGLGKGLVIILE